MQFLKLSLVSVLSLTLLACGDDKKDSISNADAEAAAKEMVADARNFIAANDLQSVDDSAQAFTAELEDSQMLGSDEANKIYQTLFITAKAIQHAAEEGAEESFEENGITVAVNNGHYSVEQEYEGLNVTMAADLAVTHTSDESSVTSGNTSVVTSSDDYVVMLNNLTGEIAGTTLRLNISTGSLHSVIGQDSNLSDNTVDNEFTEAGTTDVDVILQLAASMQEIDSNKENKITLSGNFSVKIKGSDEYVLMDMADYNSNQHIYHITSGEVTFNGQLADEIGNNIGVEIKLAMRDQSYVDLIDYNNPYNDSQYLIAGDNPSDKIYVRFEANLAGIDKNAIIELTLNASETSYEYRIKAQFQGKSLEFKVLAKTIGDSTSSIIALSHSNGAVLTLRDDYDESNGEIGYISIKGKKAAIISMNDQGIYIVRYISGSFESLQ